MMERDFYHNDFEELLKEKADQYKMYPSDKVWKGIDRSLRSRRKWYWSGFVILLSGISYVAITELIKPSSTRPVASAAATVARPVVNPRQLVPFSAALPAQDAPADAVFSEESVISGITVEDSGNITASFEIPLQLLDPENISDSREKASLFITGLEPLGIHEEYNIQLSWPTPGSTPAERIKILNPRNNTLPEEINRINWLQEQAAYKLPASSAKTIRWQLAFSPTVNYRKLTGTKNALPGGTTTNVPLSVNLNGDVKNLVNHKPALGFELGTHGLLSLGKRLTLKAGVQFNYSKYDISAFKTSRELATIALNSSLGSPAESLTSYTDIRNFGGNSVEALKNQYFQISVPVGLELRILGNERLQLNIASTIQPTYLLNQNTYMITTDFKNYTKEPSLVRKWNVNAGAEAFLSYNRGGVKWQIGPQFRYQLLSSYKNEYPIKEYLMEYGIKVGITKTIR